MESKAGFERTWPRWNTHILTLQLTVKSFLTDESEAAATGEFNFPTIIRIYFFFFSSQTCRNKKLPKNCINRKGQLELIDYLYERGTKFFPIPKPYRMNEHLHSSVLPSTLVKSTSGKSKRSLYELNESWWPGELSANLLRNTRAHSGSFFFFFVSRAI